MIFNKVAKAIQWEKEKSINNAGKTGWLYSEKQEHQLTPPTIPKMHDRLKGKRKTVKL